MSLHPNLIGNSISIDSSILESIEEQFYHCHILCDLCATTMVTPKKIISLFDYGVPSVVVVAIKLLPHLMWNISTGSSDTTPSSACVLMGDRLCDMYQQIHLIEWMAKKTDNIEVTKIMDYIKTIVPNKNLPEVSLESRHTAYFRLLKTLSRMIDTVYSQRESRYALFYKLLLKFKCKIATKYQKIEFKNHDDCNITFKFEKSYSDIIFEEYISLKIKKVVTNTMFPNLLFILSNDLNGILDRDFVRAPDLNVKQYFIQNKKDIIQLETANQCKSIEDPEKKSEQIAKTLESQPS